APEKMDPIANGISSSPPILYAKGIAIGVKIAIVPQEVPVENEINIPITKTRKGINAGVIQLSVELTTYSAVPSTSVTVPMDQASTIMISAGSIVVIPAKIVSSISLKPTF